LVSLGIGDDALTVEAVCWTKAVFGAMPYRLVDDRLSGLSVTDHPCTQSAAKGQNMHSLFMVYFRERWVLMWNFVG
jgi:hypothetical protein